MNYGVWLLSSVVFLLGSLFVGWFTVNFCLFSGLGGLIAVPILLFVIWFFGGTDERQADGLR